MDVFTALDSKADYSSAQLQVILAAWVMSTGLGWRRKISVHNGDVAEADYHKQSVYSLLYSIYRTIGTVRNEDGEPYEFTFNTWGYAWPERWGRPVSSVADPQRFGKNAYAGLFARDAVREYVEARDGKVHVMEMGCGTGAGAHHVCTNVLSKCTYDAIDMQHSAIQTCKRKFVPALGHRLRATCADASRMSVRACSADFVAVCETHVTEYPGRVTDEDRRFFRQAHRALKPGGYMVWGNAIPDETWQPCFHALEAIGFDLVEVHDVTEEAILARDQDKARMDAYVETCLRKFHGFRIPYFGRRSRVEAEAALKNFSRHPGTNLYQNMKDRRDTYKVVLLRKRAA